jgi:methyl-accepting chemotaxis protein PixJ
MLKKRQSNPAQTAASLGQSPEITVLSSQVMDGAMLQPPGTPRRLWSGQSLRLGNLSLRAKVTMAAILLGTVPVVAIGGMAYSVANQTITKSVYADQSSKSEELLDKLNRFIFERYGDVQIVANLPAFKNGKVRAVVTPQERTQILEKFKETYVVYDSIAIFDLEGNVLAQTAGPALPNHKDREYFQEVVKTTKPYISQPELSKSTGTLVIHFAAPLIDQETGKMIGVARTRLPASYLDTLVRAYGGQGVDYQIAAANSKIFIASQESQLNRNINEMFDEIAGFRQTGKTQVSETTEKGNGEKRLLGLAATQPLNGMPNLDWSVAYSKKTAEAFQSQREIALILALGTLVAAGTVAGLAAFLVKRATQPIEDAALAVEKIGQGNLADRLTVTSDDELGMLGSNINLMADQLSLLLGRQTRATELGQALSAIALQLRQLDGADELLNTALQEARITLAADRTVLYRFNPDWTGFVSHESNVGHFTRALTNKIEDACISPELIQAYEEGRVVATNDVFNAGFHPEHLNLMHQLQIKSNLVTPVLQQGKLYGILVAHHCQAPHAWEQSEIDFLRQLALQVGYALDQSDNLATVERARVEARTEADTIAADQRQQKEFLQKRALELLMEVDPASRGDLTTRAKVTPDEVGTIADSYNAIIGSLQRLVTQVQTSSQTVSDTASSNEMAVSNLSDEAKRQMISITAALSQVRATVVSVEGVADRARQAELGVQQANRTIQEGDAAMNRTVEGISTIRETVSETAKKVKRLGEASQKISKVVNLISGFAAQTNLLALNAAIEAARAGEEGRGFAVVAEEVRSLAQQSAVATAEIEQLVEEIQSQTNQVVTAMEAGTEQVVAGTQLVGETRSKLSEITAVSSQIGRLVQEISQATAVQTAAYSQVSHTMEQVAAIADDSSKQSETVAESFTQLLQVAQSLQVSVSEFKVK